ncbi:ABC transporter permease [Jatrophihabitans telluris]|uniref:ABC transporter permease n=1 Tax=Jatrophihabitans telluris TaxID=2038343 RepID=A0ABY4QV53_9ACTN|nr:ABC transporter permease [Jatrophihabitans telluris]UQX86865.1 ABC transporter permease [Jatrophihabitans telluris]
MINSLRSELLKLRSLRGTWVVAAVAAILSTIIGVALVRTAIHDRTPIPAWSEVAMGPVQALWFLVVVTAIVVSAGEFQHRTIRTTALLTPSRRRLLLSKSLASAAFGATTLLAGTGLATLSGFVTARLAGSTMPLGRLADVGHLVAAVALGALWSVLATALGILTRNTAVAITAVLLWRFVGEGLLPVVLSPHGDAVARWTPTGAGRALVGETGLPAGTAALVVGAFVAAACTAAALHFTRHDPV